MRRVVVLPVVVALMALLGMLPAGAGVAPPAIDAPRGPIPHVAAGTPRALVFGPHQRYRIGSRPMSVVTGDFTGDGLTDVAVSTTFSLSPRRDYKVWLFRQKLDGSIRDALKYPTDLAYSDNAGLAAGDLNADGLTDLALATATGVDIFTQASGRLSAAVLFPVPNAEQVQIEDVVGGRGADLVVNSNFEVTIVRNVRGTLEHGPQISLENKNIEAGDVTNDGLADLVANSRAAVYVSAQTVPGVFADPVSYPTIGGRPTQGLELADVTGDGLDDAIVTLASNSPDAAVDVFPGDPGSIFAMPLRYESYDIPQVVAAADLDDDGRADVVTIHDGWNAAGVYLQAADGTLAPEQLVPIPRTSHANEDFLSLGDVNGDDKIDILFTAGRGLIVLPQA